MREFFEFSQREDVRALVGGLLELPAIQGIVVDYDPLWLALWRLRTRIGDDRLSRHIERWGPGFLSWALATDRVALGDWPGGAATELESPDSRWRPSHWDELRHEFWPDLKDSGPPFVIKAVTLPRSGGDNERGRDFLRAFESSSLALVEEVRAPAELASPLRAHRPLEGGISIGHGPSESATLGGVVQAEDGRRRGVTCAHALAASVALDQPARADGGAAAKIGQAGFISILSPLPPNKICNPYQTGTVLNSVDAALIDFDPGVSANLEVLGIGRLTGTIDKSDVASGSLVEVVGKKSGTRMLEVGGLALTYRIRDQASGNRYCFHHLFELRFPSLTRLLFGRPIQRGDSGAWTIGTTATGPQWSGMVIAGDRFVGYACFASEIIDWASREHGLSLSVV